MDPISIITLVTAVLKFIVNEVPAFIKAYKLYAKDSKYANQVDKYNAAVKKYKKTKDLKDLIELSK
jgi:hypothetical protein